MLRDHTARRRLIVFAGLVATCLVMLLVSNSGPVQELRRGVNFAVAPVQGSLAEGTRSLTEVLGAFGEIDALRRENIDLRDSVQQLQDQVAAFESMVEENKRLTRLLEVRDRVPQATVAAGVIGRQATQFERVLTIDRGSASGIRQGAPVLSEGGALAGRISEVGENWAAVMLISDTRSLVIGLDSRTRATGEVTGRLSAPLAMANIPRTDRSRSMIASSRPVSPWASASSRLPARHPHRTCRGRAGRAGRHRPDRARAARRPTSTASRTCSSSSTSARPGDRARRASATSAMPRRMPKRGVATPREVPTDRPGTGAFVEQRSRPRRRERRGTLWGGG